MLLTICDHDDAHRTFSGKHQVNIKQELRCAQLFSDEEVTITGTDSLAYQYTIGEIMLFINGRVLTGKFKSSRLQYSLDINLLVLSNLKRSILKYVVIFTYQ